MRKKVSVLEKRRRRSGGAPPRSARQPRDDRERRREEPPPAQDPCEAGFRFDPYWDEAFAAYYDPTMGTCCRR